MDIISDTRPPAAPVSPIRLAQIAMRTASHPELWLSLVRYESGRRWYMRLAQDTEYEIWLLSWLPAQQTGFHDHGPSAGAVAVAHGCLRERAAPGGRPEHPGRTLTAGSVRSFGPDYVHDVRNESPQPAVSIHAYSPPLTRMHRFAVTAGGLLRATGVDRSW